MPHVSPAISARKLDNSCARLVVLHLGGLANGSAVSAYLGRLSSRYALAAAGSFHLEFVEQNARPDALRGRECRRGEALDRQQRRRVWHQVDRKSTRLNSSNIPLSTMPSSP